MRLQGGEDFPGSQVPIRERRRILPFIVLALILIAVGFLGASVWLNWTILQYMYNTKAGLNWFSINFYGGLTFAVAALLALLFVNPIPRRSDLFEAFNALMGLQYRQATFGGFGGQMPQRRVRPMYIRPSKTLWAFWQLVKWVVLFAFFSLSNGFPLLGNFTITVDLALRGFGSWANVARIFSLPFAPASGQEIITLVPAMEIQYQIITYMLTVLMFVLAIRFFLKFIRDVVIRAGDKWIRNIFVTLSAIVFSVFIGIPYWGMDITIPYEWGAVLTVLLAFVFLAIFYQFRSTRETIPLAGRKRVWMMVAAIVIIGLLLLNLGAFTYYRLNFNNNYITYQWDPLVSKQITVGRWAAGIQNINYTDISHIPSGNTTETLGLIRQWDSNSSLTQSQNRLGVNWLQLVSTPQIVYVNNKEYWVSPTTFQYPDPTDWIATHLIYTHSSKIIVMDTHTGDFVNATTAFGLKSQPPMYYGEDNAGIPGFANDVYVHVAQAPPEVENVSYSGAPDYTVCGAQRALYFLEQGQVGYALSPPQDCIQMLHDREVFSRVQNVLIYGLVEDSSTYIVTDSAAGGNNLYFAIQIYIDYPLSTSFAYPDQSYLRFFGVVLVNIADGSMQGYTVAQNDSFLQSFYKQYYPTWGPPPAWLKPQLRYPEQLLGNQQVSGQLDADFMLHVDNPSVWRSGSDFYERPSNTQVLYIPWVSGNNVSFAAIQLVEFLQSTGKNLAGLYVIYGGNQLGQMTLYSANSTSIGGSVPLLGPTAAENAFNTDYATHQAITLTGASPGNILLYPVNGHLYYFIPAYIYQKSGTSVVARNPFIDVIDAFNSSASVRLIYTNSSLASTYGFSGVIQASNSTIRSLYVQSLFASTGLTLSNATVSNVNIVDNVGSTNYQSDNQNSSATTFIRSFINSYVLNSTITGGQIAFNSVFYWSPTTGTLNFGFVVSDNGVTKLYYISVIVGP